MKTTTLLSALLLSAILPALPAPKKTKGEYLVYVGTSGAKTKGIYAWRFVSSSGELTPLGLVAETANPSFITIHPNGRFLYAVNEINNYQGGKSGSVSAFSIDAASGKLAPLNQVSSVGGGPAYVSVDKTGRDALVANYGTGVVAVLPIKADGSLGEASSSIQHTGSSVIPKRQAGPHAHSINVSPDNRFAIAADLGLDQVLVYKFDAAAGKITPNDPPFVKVKPGGGPRHLSFHPNGKFAYLVNEMGGAVTAFSWNAAPGVLTEIQTISTLPEKFDGRNGSAEVLVHPNGRFLYASNRGPDNLALFTVDPKKGTLTFVERIPTGGKTPRNFRIDPTGKWLLAANQDTDNIVLFRIDQKTGRLTAAGKTIEAPGPTSIKFVELK